MLPYILFRSHKVHSTKSGSNILTHRGRGSDFADIGPYIVWDDTRDISWKHSARTETLSKKIRIDEESFPIIVIQDIDASHGFFTEQYSKSTYTLATELIERIVTSCKKYHFPIETIQVTPDIKNIRNSMIFYITSSLDAHQFEEIRWLTESNDLIVVHVFHPYEVSPDSSLILWGFSVKKDSYQKEFEKIRKNIEKTIQSARWSYIMITTNTDSVSELNRFFKTRIPF